MTARVRWSDACTPDVRRIPWRTASRVCAAVFRFAETGEGPVERILGADPSLFGIRVAGAVALARFDADNETIFVLRIYAAR